MSQDIEDTANLRVRGVFLWPAWSLSGGLVVTVGVEDQFADELAGGSVDDADVQVMDEEQDAGAGVGSSDADVVELSVVPEGDEPGGVQAAGSAQAKPRRPGVLDVLRHPVLDVLKLDTTPATRCENAPLAAMSRAGGAILLRPGVCHLVAL
jgi:hypothetical protein